ncbi:MAG: ABC transporter ATP-binding protein [Pseudomonadota bacterium]
MNEAKAATVEAGGEAAIRARGVRKVYGAASGGAGAKTALHGVDITVPRGSVYGLLGPNGAGKSSFINILAGLVMKTAGDVVVWGFDIDKDPRNARASLGVVPQELSIDPFLTPREALEAQAGLYGVPKARRRTDEILGALGLGDKADAGARTLSGGMKRRLLVAKALVHRPPILVLDEPTAGVDIELRRSLWAYVRELNQDGVTVILTTHYLEEAEAMCDRIAIIDQGRLAAEAPTGELLATLEQKTLVIRPDGAGGEALRAAFAAALPSGARLSWRETGAAAVTYRRRSVSPEAILAACRASGLAIADLTSEEPDLEDVFLTLTGAAAPQDAAE